MTVLQHLSRASIDALAYSPGQKLVALVAELYDLDARTLTGRSRVRNIVEARMMGYWLARTCWPNWSYPMIGKLFGGRDHSTVIHGIKQMQYRMEANPELAAAMREMAEAIRTHSGDTADGRPPRFSEVHELAQRLFGNATRAPLAEVEVLTPPVPRRTRMMQRLLDRKVRPQDRLRPEDIEGGDMGVRSRREYMLGMFAGSDALAAQIEKAGGWPRAMLAPARATMDAGLDAGVRA